MDDYFLFLKMFVDLDNGFQFTFIEEARERVSNVSKTLSPHTDSQAKKEFG